MATPFPFEARVDRIDLGLASESPALTLRRGFSRVNDSVRTSRASAAFESDEPVFRGLFAV